MQSTLSRTYSLLLVFSLLLLFSCKKIFDDRVKLHIKFINPTEGRKGTLLNIEGGEFDLDNNKNKAWVNNIQVEVIESYYSSIVVRIPDDPNCSGKVKVRVGNEVAESEETFTYLIPSIRYIEPAYGEAGDTIKIIGDYFCPGVGVNTVTLNGIPATIVSMTSTTATVIVPDDKNTTGLVSITSCKATGRSVTPFTYMPSAQSVTTIAGSIQVGYRDGAGQQALFYSPMDLAINKNNEIFVTDQWNYAIRKIDNSGMVSTLAGSKPHGFLDGPGNQAKFYLLAGITISNAGDLYVVDFDNFAIRKISRDGMVSTVFRNLTDYMKDVLIKGDTLFFTKGYNIYYKKEGEEHKLFAGRNQTGLVDGIEANAGFNAPSYLHWDPVRGFIVSDRTAIRLVTNDAQVTTFSKPGGPTLWINGVEGVTSDSKGTIYYVESGYNAIKRISPDGRVTTIAGTGYKGLKDGPALQAEFNDPSGIAIDMEGNLIIADTRNNCIRKLVMR